MEAQDAAAGSTAQLQPYTNTQQQYRLSIPADWEKKDKAGKVALQALKVNAVRDSVCPWSDRSACSFHNCRLVQW